MTPANRLKFAAAWFGLFWTAGMLWWSGSAAPVHVALMGSCGITVGYLWYRLMRRLTLPSPRWRRDRSPLHRAADAGR